MAFFSKTNVMITFLHNLDLFLSQKHQFFAYFLGENIFKIITSVPGPETINLEGLRSSGARSKRFCQI
jgi:hypothetical protein